MGLDLRALKRHAKQYVELEAHAKVTSVTFVKRHTLFGKEDVILLVLIDDPTDPAWWVIGGSTPMNLYSKKSFPESGMAYTLHQGLVLQIADRDYTESAKPPSDIGYDAFISHASEDKRKIVKPLAIALGQRGYRIWYDEFELTVGDSLRQSIDKGLASSRFGIIVLSPSFFAKNWPQYELNGLVAKEMDGHKVILPVWHGVTKADVLSYSPPLADKVAAVTGKSVNQVAAQLAKAMDLSS